MNMFKRIRLPIAIVGAFLAATASIAGQNGLTSMLRSTSLESIEAAMTSGAVVGTIPNEPLVLAQMVMRVDDLLGSLAQVRAGTSSDEYAQGFKSIDEMTAIIGSAAAADCSSSSGAGLFSRFTNARADIAELPIQTMQFDDSAESVESCAELVRFAANPALPPVLLTLRQRLESDAQRTQAQAQRVVNIRTVLTTRQAELQKAMSSQTNRQTLLQSLWLTIGAIGLLSLGVMFTVRFFDHQIQMEWVTSGQVIQFVTVMVLLSVIMALGLTEILREETLGTLLGGIAGYVLSQGVGRAVAREVTRQGERQFAAGAQSAASQAVVPPVAGAAPAVS